MGDEAAGQASEASIRSTCSGQGYVAVLHVGQLILDSSITYQTERAAVKEITAFNPIAGNLHKTPVNAASC